MIRIPPNARIAIMTVIQIARLHRAYRDRKITKKYYPMWALADDIVGARRALDKIAQALAKRGIFQGERGPIGGYRLGRHPRNITLREIVTIAASIVGDPEDAYNGEGLPLNAAYVEGALERAHEAFMASLGSVTIADALEALKDDDEI